MDSLPPEIKRMVVFYLRNCDADPSGPWDIKQLRLVNRTFSIIGAEYLLPDIYLAFQSQSFRRLKDISEHPIISQYVQRLRYEPDSFGERQMSYSAWLKRCNKAPVIRSTVVPFEPWENEGQRTEHIDHRELQEFKNEEAAARLQLSPAYESYKTVWSDQMHIRQHQDPYYADMVAKAVARLPKLAGVTLNFAHGVVPHSTAFEPAYSATFHLPDGDVGHRSPYGVTQLCSVLFGVASAGTKLRSLDCGKIDWKFLEIGETDMERIKLVVKHLEYFRITFFTGKYHFLGELGGPTEETRKCKDFLQKNGLCELVSAAKDLKVLSLKFDEPSAAELKYIVGTTTWASLRMVELTRIRAAEDTIIEFLERHAGTLKELGLNDILLLRDQGDWNSLLPRIRKAVQLDEFRAVGVWWSDHPYQRWEIDTSLYSSDLTGFSLDPPCELGNVVKNYILNGGVCPPLDPDKYEMLPLL